MMENPAAMKKLFHRLSLDAIEVYLWYACVAACVFSVVQIALRGDLGLLMIALLTLSMFLFVTLFTRQKRIVVPPLFRYFFIMLTLVVMGFSVQVQQWEVPVNGLLTLLLLAAPLWMRRHKLVKIPALFQIVVLLYALASMYCGEVLNFYYHLNWWDLIVHLVSAPFIGYAGFLLIYTINKDRHIHERLSPFFLALFAFCFSMLVGTAWELFEFGVDATLGMNMQKARHLEELYGYFDTRLGVLDTMEDLVIDAIGALLVSIIGYRYLKRDSTKAASFWRLKDQFIEDNPHLFD